MKEIKLTYCKLRDLCYDDLLKIKEWRNSQIDILRQNGLLTDGDQQKYWERIKNSEKEKLFAITDLDGDLIGYGGFVHIDKHSRKAEISFLLNTQIKEDTEQYSLLFKEFLEYLINLGFGELGFNRIFTETYEFRKSPIKILESVGFKKEGELRENVMKNNVFYNSLVHSIIKRDY